MYEYLPLFSTQFLFLCRDRNGGAVNQTVLHGVMNSFVNVEEYKKKEQVQVSKVNSLSQSYFVYFSTLY